MTESFLHYVWRHTLYQFADIHTTDGCRLQVVHPGYPHQDAGPDFKQAVIKIDDITWAGDVELHLKSSDWLKHGHQNDAKYRSVILHVVYEHDTDILRMPGEHYPTLALKNYIPQPLLEEYLKLSRSENDLPCQAQLSMLSRLQLTSILSGKAIERLFHKQEHIVSIVNQCQANWEEAFFRILAMNFGFKTNTTAFELLGRSLPFKYIQKHAQVRTQVYALLFGQAGMLEENIIEDDYCHALFEEYHYLKYKYRLTPIPEKSWNYLRLRPRNFAALRLAQLSELLHNHPHLFQQMREFPEQEQIEKLFVCSPHPYWETHSKFGKTTTKRDCAPGKETINLLLINTVVPMLFAHAAFHGEEALQQKALTILEQCPFEKNSITMPYKEAGFPTDSALESQAIIELHHHYCKKKRCLDCEVGSTILRRTKVL